MPTPLTYQTNGMPVEEGFCVQVDANGYIPNISYLRKIYAKTASYTVKETESGAVFTTTGNTAALVFTLPAVASSTGMEFIFLNTVNQTMTFDFSDFGVSIVVKNERIGTSDRSASEVATKIAAHKFEQRGRFRDYAILYRGNHQARVIEQQLRNQRIPYVMSGGQSFFDKAEIRDLIAWLRLLANEDDDLAFIRAITTPRRGIGAGTLEALGHYAGQRHISLFAAVFEEGAAQHLNARQLHGVHEFASFINRLQYRAAREPAAALLHELLGAIGYEAWLFEHNDTREAEARWRNVSDFVGWLGRKGEEDGKTLIELTQTIALMSMLDKEDPDFDGVQLATLHAAKGLEFPHVFLVGVEEGLLPHQSSIDEDKVEEERRLMYVGITRAQRSLNLTWCERRKMGKEFRTCEASRFIAEMGADVRLNDRKTAAPVSKEEGKARLANLMAMLENRPDTPSSRP